MEYQFEFVLRTDLPLFEMEEEIEKRADEIIDGFIATCKLQKEYPDADYTLSDRKLLLTTMHIHYGFKYDIEASSIEQAEKNIPETIKSLLEGSELAQQKYTIESHLSDEQPGLEDILENVDSYLPFVIQVENELYHPACAEEIYGEIRMRKAEHHRDDEITAVYGWDWKNQVRNAFANKEELYFLCSHCDGSLYDNPKHEEE
jgi:hypothetical protein